MDFHQEMIEEYRPELHSFFVTKKDGEQISSKIIERQIRSKNGTILIAKDNNRIIGYTNLAINEYPPLFNIERIGKIIALFVDEEYRGKNASSLLFQESRKWFKQKNIKHIMLNVLPDNKHAKEIYKHWGFSCFVEDMRLTL